MVGSLPEDRIPKLKIDSMLTYEDIIEVIMQRNVNEE
jgi:hypothetical protein